jgi:hypothetical protein
MTEGNSVAEEIYSTVKTFLKCSPEAASYSVVGHEYEGAIQAVYEEKRLLFLYSSGDQQRVKIESWISTPENCIGIGNLSTFYPHLVEVIENIRRRKLPSQPMGIAESPANQE